MREDHPSGLTAIEGAGKREREREGKKTRGREGWGEAERPHSWYSHRTGVLNWIHRERLTDTTYDRFSRSRGGTSCKRARHNSLREHDRIGISNALLSVPSAFSLLASNEGTNEVRNEFDNGPRFPLCETIRSQWFNDPRRARQIEFSIDIVPRLGNPSRDRFVPYDWLPDEIAPSAAPSLHRRRDHPEDSPPKNAFHFTLHLQVNRR